MNTLDRIQDLYFNKIYKLILKIFKKPSIQPQVLINKIESGDLIFLYNCKHF